MRGAELIQSVSPTSPGATYGFAIDISGILSGFVFSFCGSGDAGFSVGTLGDIC